MARKGEKFIFYHIMKTGGVWVRHALQKAGVPTELCESDPYKRPLNLNPPHASPAAISDEDKAGRFSFCFVRHPLTWYQSFWCFRWPKNSPPDHNWYKPGVWSDDFNTFVTNVMDNYPEGFLTWYYQQYVGESLDGVDFIGRKENLVEDLVIALNLAGQEFDEEILRNTPPYNFSRRWQKRRAQYEDVVRERVLKMERFILEAFY